MSSLASLPTELVSKVIMMNRPTYKYMDLLNQVHKFMHNEAEDYDGDFNMGVCCWNRHIRALKDEPSMDDWAKSEGECCFPCMVDMHCMYEPYTQWD